MCKRQAYSALIGAILAASGAARSAADVRFVDDDAPLGGDGSSWNSAYRFLQDALFEAAADPNIIEIRVAGGLYKPDQDEDAMSLRPIAAHRS